MKIMFFHNSIPEYRRQLFELLAKGNPDLVFIFTDMMKSKEVYNTPVGDRPLQKLRCECLPTGWRCIGQTRSLLKKYQPDVVLLPAIDSLREFVIAQTILATLGKRARYAYFWEKWEAPREYAGFAKRIKNGIQAFAARCVFRRTQAFLSPGMKTTEYLCRQGVKKEQIHIFHDVSDAVPCPVYDVRAQFGIEQGRKVYLYYGRIIKRKGLDLLLRALSQCQYRDQIHLVVAGDGEFRPYCESLCQELQLKHVSFAGFVPPEEKYIFFSQSDVFILPSVAEGGTIEAWGLTVNEAILTNNFVICSDIVGAGFELISPENGIVFRQNDAEDLKRTLDAAYRFEKDASFYAKNRMIAETYTFENMCQDFERVFEGLYATRRADP